LEKGEVNKVLIGVSKFLFIIFLFLTKDKKVYSNSKNDHKSYFTLKILPKIKKHHFKKLHLF
jgi:hypothetical protein